MIVPEPRFYLKNIKAEEPTLICFQAKYERERVFLSTGNKIHPNEWDFTLQRTKVSRRNLANGDINVWLNKMANEFQSIFRNCMIDGSFPEAKFIMQRMQENLNLINKPVVEQKTKITLFLFIDQYIRECKSLKAVATVKSYEGTFF